MTTYYPKIGRLITLWLLVLLGGFSLSAKDYQIEVKDYGILPNGENVSPRIEAMLRDLKAKVKPSDNVILLFDKGTYHFYEAGAPEREFYISNHDHAGSRRIGLLLEGFSNLMIMGRRTLFLFHDRMLPVAVVGCQNIFFDRIHIDFVDTEITQVEVVESRGKEGGMLFRPAPWVKWRIDSDGYFVSYGSNWSSRLGSGIVFDKASGRTAYRISDLSYTTQGTREVSPGVLQAPKWQDERIKPGMIVAMRSYYRPQPAVFVDQSRGVAFSRMSIYYADGMGFLCQNSEELSIDACAVMRKEYPEHQSKRYYTTQADATHFSGCSGMVSVGRSLFEGMMDDAINVHGVYLNMTKRIDDRTVEARYMHPQAYGFEWGVPGDTVQFVFSQTFDSHDERNVIKTITPVDKPTVSGAKVFRISFAKPLDESLTPEASIGLENMRKVAVVEFYRNWIRYNRARGALFNTPRHVEVRANIFDHISGAAIVSSTDCNMWFESGQTQDMHIHGNLFRDVLTSLYQFTEAVISLHPVIPKLKEQKMPFYGKEPCGIVIEGNRFETFDTPLLYAKSVRGLCWRHNELRPTESYPKYHWNQEAFKLEGCRNITIDSISQKVELEIDKAIAI